MKFLNNQTTKLSTLLLLVSTTGFVVSSSLSLQAKEARLTNNPSEIVITAKNSQTQNTFTAVGEQQPTTGTVKVVKENGKRYLVFSSDFNTPDGPDVFVVLHRNQDIETSIEEEDYINIARLETFSGGQRYLIGDDVNLDDFQSIGIWCREFNVTFAFAPLK